MKKFLSMLLVMVMIFSLSVLATEVSQQNDVAEENVVADEATIENTVEPEKESEKEQIYFRAKVTEASEVGEKEYKMNYYGQEMTMPVTGQDIKLLVQDGKYKGVEINLVYPLGEQGTEEYETPAKVGQKIYIQVSENKADDGTVTYNGQVVLPINPVREKIVIIAIIAILVVLVLLSRCKSIRTIGIILVNAIILLITFGTLYLKAIPALVILTIAALAIIISNVLIINNLSKKSLVAILGILIATVLTTGLCVFMINTTDVRETFLIGTYSEGETAKPEYIDVVLATMVIASIGVTISVGLKTVKEYMKGNGVLKAMQNASAGLVKCLNVVLLVGVGTILTNLFYIGLQNYPIHMIFFGDDNAFIELVKIIVLVVNPIIVVPITAIISKFILEPTKGIEEAK